MPYMDGMGSNIERLNIGSQKHSLNLTAKFRPWKIVLLPQKETKTRLPTIHFQVQTATVDG